jgi:hypothetical protein
VEVHSQSPEATIRIETRIRNPRMTTDSFHALSNKAAPVAPMNPECVHVLLAETVIIVPMRPREAVRVGMADPMLAQPLHDADFVQPDHEGPRPQPIRQAGAVNRTGVVPVRAELGSVVTDAGSDAIFQLRHH